MRLVERGAVSVVVVMHVDTIFAIGCKGRFDQCGADLNEYVRIANLGEASAVCRLQFHAGQGCRYHQDLPTGVR